MYGSLLKHFFEDSGKWYLFIFFENVIIKIFIYALVNEF